MPDASTLSTSQIAAIHPQRTPNIAAAQPDCAPSAATSIDNHRCNQEKRRKITTQAQKRRTISTCRQRSRPHPTNSDNQNTISKRAPQPPHKSCALKTNRLVCVGSNEVHCCSYSSSRCSLNHHQSRSQACAAASSRQCLVTSGRSIYGP